MLIETLGRDGGAERFLADILPRLRQFGFTFDVIVLNGPYDLEPELNEGGVRTFRVDTWHRWFLPQPLWKIFRITRGMHYDVVWSHLYFANLHGAIFRMLRTGTRHVTILHSSGYGLNPPKSAWQRCRMRLEQMWGLYLVDTIVSMSNATAEDYSENLGWKDIRILPHAVPLEDMPPRPDGTARRQLRVAAGLAEDDFCFISIARLAPQKGLSVLIAAFEILAKEGLRPACLIVGAGGLESSLRDQIRLAGLSHSVRIIPPMPHKDLMRLLQVCDAFVLSSIYEPQGIAAGEAMGLGVPCILSDVEGLRIWNGEDDAALMVRPGDSTALAAALKRLIFEPRLRSRLSHTGALRIRKKFSPETNATQWAELLLRAKSP